MLLCHGCCDVCCCATGVVMYVVAATGVVMYVVVATGVVMYVVVPRVL